MILAVGDRDGARADGQYYIVAALDRTVDIAVDLDRIVRGGVIGDEIIAVDHKHISARAAVQRVAVTAADHCIIVVVATDVSADGELACVNEANARIIIVGID